MKIYRLSIENFRGIQLLDWKIKSSLVCLIGPGNATKTTILESIYLALYPTWNLSLSDVDFHNSNVDIPISITVTVGELPKKLLDFYKFSECYGGRNKNGDLSSEPISDDENTLTIQLKVDKSLEPKWFLISERLQEEREISFRDRAELEVFFAGNSIDREFVWHRGSSISKLTTEDSEIQLVLAKASRIARAAIKDDDFQELQKVAKIVNEIANNYGVSISNLRPALDSQTWGIVSLHDNRVPFRLSGLGTRRLMAIGLQSAVADNNGILLIDEIEQGLEPYRLRNLVSQLNPNDGLGQTFMTTHAPVVVSQMDVDEIHFVQNTLGKITIRTLADYPDLKKSLKEVPEAFLAKKTIVCEGQTELSLCESLDRVWHQLGNKRFASIGVVPLFPEISGGNKKSPEAAKALAVIGYTTMYFGDSDKPLKPSEVELRNSEVNVIIWSDKLCTEQRVFFDMPWAAIEDLVCGYIACREQEMGQIENALEVVAQHIKDFDHADNTADAMMRTLRDISQYKHVVSNWGTQLDERRVREILGTTAHKNNWFKSKLHADKFAAIVCSHISTIDSTTDLAVKLDNFKQWVYGQ